MPADSEIELKLDLVSGKAAHVRRLFPGTSFERAVVRTVYLDTGSGLLRQHGLALRLRRDGERWVQTLKSGDRSGSLVTHRGEWEADLGTGRSRPSLDLGRLKDSPMQPLLAAGLRASDLVPVFETRFVRLRATVAHRQSSIEVAIDRGDLVARVGGRVERQPIAEVEFELKAGNAADVLHLARKSARADGAVMVPSMRSKADRGFALATGSGLAVVRASASGFTASMARRFTPQQALRALARHALGIVIANADAVRTMPQPEHIHQARVALRRLRAGIRLIDPANDDLPATLARELRWLARKLGDARDWDVLVEITLPDIVAGGVAEKHTADLRQRAAKHRERALRAAAAAVSSRRYALLVLDAAAWASSDPPGNRARLADSAPVLADVLADEVATGASAFLRMSRPQQHRVRIQVKRLRYALDLLRIDMPKKAIAAYIEALAAVQDTLGSLNDAAVAWNRLRDTKLRPASLEAVRSWHATVEPPLVRQAARKLVALARRARPWSKADR